MPRGRGWRERRRLLDALKRWQNRGTPLWSDQITNPFATLWSDIPTAENLTRRRVALSGAPFFPSEDRNDSANTGSDALPAFEVESLASVIDDRTSVERSRDRGEPQKFASV
jgi:hypothetical protein